MPIPKRRESPAVDRLESNYNDHVLIPDRKAILRNVTVELRSKELIGIMGPSGSGKTTFLNVLANLLKGYHVQVGRFRNEWVSTHAPAMNDWPCKLYEQSLSRQMPRSEMSWKNSGKVMGSNPRHRFAYSRSEALRIIDSAKFCLLVGIFGWVDKAQCFRSARHIGAADFVLAWSSPEFFSRHLACLSFLAFV